jgi:hypothetical protein
LKPKILDFVNSIEELKTKFGDDPFTMEKYDEVVAELTEKTGFVPKDFQEMYARFVVNTIFET